MPDVTETTRWSAPFARRPIDADVGIPGSKSLTNRYLVLAALAGRPSRIRSPLHSRDTELMAAALTTLGATIAEEPGTGRYGSDWRVTPPRVIGASPATVDCGLAGTVMRFIPPVAALSSKVIRFDGDDGARRRPMSETIESLRALGVRVEDDGRSAMPFTTTGSPQLAGGRVVLDASSSSQFVSGLLLAGCRFQDGVDVVHIGDVLPSVPHIRMTTEVLAEAGIEVDDTERNRWRVAPGVPHSLDVTVEPDLSNAAPFVAAAVVTAGTVRIAGWPRSTTQAGDRMRTIAERFGADVRLDDSGLTVTGAHDYAGIDLDLHDVGELTPVVTAMAALATSPSRLTGIAHLRGHETNRLKALSTELAGLGGTVTETDDGLVIEPAVLHDGVFDTYHDHRMAMAAAVLGLRVSGLQIGDIATTAKTLPEFPELWRSVVGSAGEA